MSAPHHRPRQRSCAVLAPVLRDRSGVLRVRLLRRGARGVHGGELTFPGGGREPQDRSLLWGLTLSLLDPAIGPPLEGVWAV
jgi:8-oxo-dGTP pyrophosphatase MutT (NUDIX family)